MGTVLMTLGPIRFSVEESAYQTLSRELEIRVAKADRADRESARQALGEDETISLDGVIYPEHAGAGRLDALRELARTRKPQMLTDGTGRVWGEWLIERVSETGTFFQAGGLPARQEFKLQLGAYGADAEAVAA